MKLDAHKVQLALARACIDLSELSKRSCIPYGTVKFVVRGRQTKPITAGKIAKALGVDVTEIIQEDEV